MTKIPTTMDIIPAEESGEFRITERMISESGAVSLAAFEVLVREEAFRRGLELSVSEEFPTRDIIVRWRPGRR